MDKFPAQSYYSSGSDSEEVEYDHQNANKKRRKMVRRTDNMSMAMKRAAIYASLSSDESDDALTEDYIKLASFLPGLCKSTMDRISIIDEAAKYIERLEKKTHDYTETNKTLKTLIAEKELNGPSEDSECSSDASSHHVPSGMDLPYGIKVQMVGEKVSVRIFCKMDDFVMDKAGQEISKLNLRRLKSQSMPFGKGMLVGVFARMEEGFCLTGDEVVNHLRLALREFLDD